MDQMLSYHFIFSRKSAVTTMKINIFERFKNQKNWSKIAAWKSTILQHLVSVSKWLNLYKYTKVPPITLTPPTSGQWKFITICAKIILNRHFLTEQEPWHTYTKTIDYSLLTINFKCTHKKSKLQNNNFSLWVTIWKGLFYNINSFHIFSWTSISDHQNIFNIGHKLWGELHL